MNDKCSCCKKPVPGLREAIHGAGFADFRGQLFCVACFTLWTSSPEARRFEAQTRTTLSDFIERTRLEKVNGNG